MKTTYKEMEAKLRNKEPFDGNSVTARINSFGYYVIESYATTIYEDKGEHIYFDNSYYSVTTSKLQNMLIDIFNLNNGVKKRD